MAPPPPPSTYSSSGVTHISNPCIYAGDFVEKKSRFTKWLGKLFKTNTHRGVGGSGGGQPQLVGDENMVWREPSTRSLGGRGGGVGVGRPRANREKEELDRAIALSMGEGLRRPPNGGYGWRPTANNNNDEALARALQDSLNLSSYPPYVVPPAHYYPRGYRLCGGCHREIGYGNYLGCMGMFFHPECFRCRSCGYPITETEFSLSGKDPYHKSCFKELTHPKCEVCLQFIPTNSAGLIEYRCHPFWSQKYCPSHEHDSTARCCSCERLEVLTGLLSCCSCKFSAKKLLLLLILLVSLFFPSVVLECKILLPGRWKEPVLGMHGVSHHGHGRLPTTLPCDQRLLRRNEHEIGSADSHAAC
ncbi:unnamed protein product [Linum tenue]|uniref:LIM zinc-binding domain-containing protein n=1 Tax=Linum tenue TaxID=586396 RepID=A0AAV0MBS0_9ROSI|nr:unnamed protein product [Linum tenue]